MCNLLQKRPAGQAKNDGSYFYQFLSFKKTLLNDETNIMPKNSIVCTQTNVRLFALPITGEDGAQLWQNPVG